MGYMEILNEFHEFKSGFAFLSFESIFLDNFLYSLKIIYSP